MPKPASSFASSASPEPEPPLEEPTPSESPRAAAPREMLKDRPIRRRFGRWARALLGDRTPEPTLKEALEEVIQEHEEEGHRLSSEEKVMLRNMLSVGERSVSDVMIRRAEIVAVDDGITLAELKDVLMRERHTRLPVYRGTLDRLRGLLHLKDLVPALAGDEPFEIDRLLREVAFVSPAMKVVDLLMQMRVSGDHMAIVVDEYGGTDGLVTMEDLFEVIVGEIQDEHDTMEPEQQLRRIAPRVYDADARIWLDRLLELLGKDFRLPGEDPEAFDTLGGLIFSHLGRVPLRGEIVEAGPDASFEILDADPRRIRKVRITLKKPVTQAMEATT